jgi:hypothetical protein
MSRGRLAQECFVGLGRQRSTFTKLAIRLGSDRLLVVSDGCSRISIQDHIATGRCEETSVSVQSHFD